MVGTSALVERIDSPLSDAATLGHIRTRGVDAAMQILRIDEVDRARSPNPIHKRASLIRATFIIDA